MLKPICVSCRLFFQPKKSGVYVEEGMPLGPVQEDGAPGSWGSYKLWAADLYECRGCGAQLVTGFGLGPVAEHYQKDYQTKREILQPLCRVDDC